MSELIVRWATREDIDAFSPMPNKPTVKALVGEIDGRIIGIGGLFRMGGRWFAFVDLPPEARQHKMAIMRAAKRIMAEVRRMGLRYVYTEADPSEPKAIAWLMSLGFELDPRSEHFYRWRADDKWQN